MHPEDYMNKSEKPEIYVETTSGSRLKANIRSMERPERIKTRNVCEGSENGEVEFNDVATISFESETEVKRLELVYRGELVALRVIPNIRMTPSDVLEIDWSLIINLNGDKTASIST